MKILILSGNIVSRSISDWLTTNGDQVVTQSDKLIPSDLLVLNPDWIISYGYRYMIKPEVLKLYPHKVINLHISLLPFNKGADPNIWSFIDGTPKGVTIHEVDEGLDTGAILCQKELNFDPRTVTLSGSYSQLQTAIQELFRNNWKSIASGQQIAQPQKSKGTLHKTIDLEPYKWIIEEYGWDITPEFFISKMQQ